MIRTLPATVFSLLLRLLAVSLPLVATAVDLLGQTVRHSPELGSLPRFETQADHRLVFRFSGASWREVLEWLGREGDIAIDAAKLPSSSVNFLDPNHSYGLAEAIETLGDLLLKDGFGVVYSDRKLTVVSLADENVDGRLLQLAPMVELSQLGRLPQSAIVRCRIDARGLSTSGKEDLSSHRDLLKDLLSPAGSCIALPLVRELMVIDTVRQLRMIRELVDQHDRPSESDDFESISLIGLDMISVKACLDRLLSTRSADIGNSVVYDADGQPIVGSSSEFRWEVDLVGGVLLVKGSRRQREQVRKLVDLMRETSQTRLAERVRVFPQDGPAMQEVILQAADVWRAAGRTIPIVLQGDSSLAIVGRRPPTQSIRILSSGGQTVVSSFDAIALDEFVSLMEQLLSAYRDRMHHNVEIAVKHLPASAVAMKVLNVIKPLHPIVAASPTPVQAFRAGQSTIVETQNELVSMPSSETASKADIDSLSVRADMEPPHHPDDTPSTHTENSSAVQPTRQIVEALSVGRLARQTTATVITPIDHQRKLLVNAGSADLATIRRLIEIFDVADESHERVPSVLRVSHRNAEEIAVELRKIFGRRCVDDLWMSAEFKGGLEGGYAMIHLQVDAKTNSLLVNAERSDIEKIRKFVLDIDRAEVASREIATAVVPLTGALQSTQLSRALVSLYGNDRSTKPELQAENQSRGLTKKSSSATDTPPSKPTMNASSSNASSVAKPPVGEAEAEIDSPKPAVRIFRK